MTTPNLPMDGSCRCGQVRLKIKAAPMVTMACHCTGCQKMSSSAFSLSAAIPIEAFEVTAGETVIGGLKTAGIDHHFCLSCMSWMFTRVEQLPWFVNVRATMLDDTGWFRPFIETYTSEKLAFAETGAPHSYEKFPPMEDMQRLVAEYAGAAA